MRTKDVEPSRVVFYSLPGAEEMDWYLSAMEFLRKERKQTLSKFEIGLPISHYNHYTTSTSQVLTCSYETKQT